MTRILLMLALAAVILDPDGPAALLILFALACWRMWRAGDAMEIGDPAGSDCDVPIYLENLPGNCDLT